MITRAEVDRVAIGSGFRPESVEKALRLLGILARLDDHELSHGRFLLKGGTAINLFHLPVPRLSVDIDLNFIGVEDLRRLPEARAELERVLIACCAREGCEVRRTPGEHAGGKFRLRYASVLGGGQNLEIDVNYVARLPLFGVERHKPSFPPGWAGPALPLFPLEELAAGKCAALVGRAAARDSFDVANLLHLAPDLVRRPRFRIAFVCQVAGARPDLRDPAKVCVEFDPSTIGRELLPLLRVGSGREAADPRALAEWLRERIDPVVRGLLAWSQEERRFLDRRLDGGEIEPEHLTDDPELQDRIARQPMLLWKQLHVRRHRRIGGGEEGDAR